MDSGAMESEQQESEQQAAMESEQQESAEHGAMEQGAGSVEGMEHEHGEGRRVRPRMVQGRAREGRLIAWQRRVEARQEEVGGQEEGGEDEEEEAGCFDDVSDAEEYEQEVPMQQQQEGEEGEGELEVLRSQLPGNDGSKLTRRAEKHSWTPDPQLTAAQEQAMKLFLWGVYEMYVETTATQVPRLCCITLA